MKNSVKLSFIGAGNLSWHLAQAFHLKGLQILQVFSRNTGKASALSKLVGAEPLSDLADLDKNSADVYIVASPDDVIEDLGHHLTFDSGKFLLHTSGTAPTDALRQACSSCGVFWPIQSFSHGSSLMDFTDIPICVSSEDQLPQLEELASIISKTVIPVADKQRLMLHIAAVFTNNFVYHVLEHSRQLLAGESISWSILEPLLQQTIQSKAGQQTGPAIRGDIKVIEKHLRALDKDADLQSLYKSLSESIQQTKK